MATTTATRPEERAREWLAPAYGRREIERRIPRDRMPSDSMDPRIAYQLISDELQVEANPALNMASFVTTVMDEEAERLIMENLGRNYIDKEVYRSTTEIEERCVNILADLFNAPDDSEFWGTAAIGSSEALMIAGVAHKRRWRHRREEQGKPADRPNIVMGRDVHITWEKFARYFEVEPRLIPLHPDEYTITAEAVTDAVDENTIAVVGVLGTSYTGQYDPIEEINDALEALNDRTGWDVPLHVDGASGAFIAPFIQPDFGWDFRLSQVRSINASGHKFGLVYPGIGWILFRDRADVPEDLFVSTNVLGFKETTFSLNFSRGAAMILGQYYNFLRLGREGYRRIMENLHETAEYLAEGLLATGKVERINDAESVPAVVLRLLDEERYNASDVVAKLAEHGWTVPALTLPPDADEVDAMRMVVKENFTRTMADKLIADFGEAIEKLEASQSEPYHPRPIEAGKKPIC